MRKFHAPCSMLFLVLAVGCAGNVSDSADEGSPVAVAEQALSGIECFLDASTCLAGPLDPFAILGLCSADFNVCIDDALATVDVAVTGATGALDSCGAAAKNCVGSGLDVGVCRTDFEGCTADVLDVPATAFADITGLKLPTDTVQFAIGCSLDSLDCAAAAGWSIGGLDVCRSDLTSCAGDAADKSIQDAVIIVGGAVDIVDGVITTAGGISGAVTGFTPTIPTLGGVFGAVDACQVEFQTCAFAVPDVAVCQAALDTCLSELEKVTPL